MAADIVPELYEKIHADFERSIKNNKKIRDFRKRLKKKVATAKEVSFYAAEVGDCTANTLARNLTEETLPDGKLYWNIAERTILPILEEAFEMIEEAAAEQQTLEDEKNGINIKPIKANFPTFRAHDFLEKLMEYMNRGTDE